MKTSSFSGFYKLSPGERQQEVAEMAGLDADDLALLNNTGSLPLAVADHMVENVIGVWPMPLGVGLNFMINGKDYLIPMAVEEPSVIAAASNMARLVRNTGGFFTSHTGPVMRAQMQAINVADPHNARARILEAKEEILARANALDPMLIKAQGGAKDVEVHIIDTEEGLMVITHLIVDTRDAMGANAVNTMVEALAPFIETLSGGRVLLRILSNLADLRLARARCTVKKEDLGGSDVVDAIITAYRFAAADPYRAATHNKGIMNGITPVITATGNDTRAIEAGAHAYAARGGRYTSLTRWEKNKDGDLSGLIELPMAVGLVGGATKVHPVARLAVKMLGVKTATELGEIAAAVGLSQNLGALRALATEGIQRGHMSLHARTIAVSAGAPPHLLEAIVETMVREKQVRVERALELISQLK